VHDVVVENFRRHAVPVAERNVQLVKGLFQDTMQLDARWHWRISTGTGTSRS
jgi:hypothetical protein